MRYLFVFTLAALLGSCGHVLADPFSVSITVDENGNGTFTNTAGFHTTLASAMQNDPGPGGLNNVLTYDLLNPPGLTAGDVLLSDPNGLVLDVVRFNPNQTIVDGRLGTLVFYSDNIDGFDSKGDTSGPPGALYPNFVVIPEIGSETNNGAIYTPTAGMPGFVAGAAGPVTYTLISDGTGPTAVPEPATLTMTGIGLLSLAGYSWRRRKPAVA
jgi:hypothetical protein